MIKKIYNFFKQRHCTHYWEIYKVTTNADRKVIHYNYKCPFCGKIKEVVHNTK